MDRQTVRVLVIAGVALLAYSSWRNGAFAGLTGRATDSLSGQPITPTDWTTWQQDLIGIRASGQAGGFI